jgi:hypothetical protein
MPSVANPIPLYTAPGKGARHSGTTPNKEGCCIQAMQGIRIALVCLMRVTLHYVFCFPFHEIVSEIDVSNPVTFYRSHFKAMRGIQCAGGAL